MEHKIYVYEWMSWDGFLFPTMYKNAIPISGKIGHKPSEIMNQISSKQGYLLFHMNLTNTKNFIEERTKLLTSLSENGITPINGKITDTTKKRIQKLCHEININTTNATIKGDPDELLIVKTNFNYAGIQEEKLSFEEKNILQIPHDSYPTDIDYKILFRKDLYENIWSNPNLAIEKFINNDDNLFYRIHKLFNRIVITEVVDPNPIRKLPDGIPVNNYFYDLSMNNISDINYLKFLPIITQVQKLSAVSHIDYAAFDVVKSDDANYYIVDINLTPYWGFTKLPIMFEFLAEAIQL